MAEQEQDFHWPQGKRVALSISFDDARPSQLDIGIPILNDNGARATFYVLPKNVEKRLEQWQAALKAGHEIGNHTLTHPCSGNYKFSSANALEDYTLEKLEAELAGANTAIETLLGVTPRTFAYPCGQKFVGRGERCQSYVPLVARHFLAGRSARDESENRPRFCDLAQVFAMGADGVCGEDLRTLVARAAEQGGWLVLVGHDVGRPAWQTFGARELGQICRFALDPVNGIWLDTIANVAEHIQASRSTRND